MIVSLGDGRLAQQAAVVRGVVHWWRINEKCREIAAEPRRLFRPPGPHAWCWCNLSLDASRSARWQHRPLWRSTWPYLQIEQNTFQQDNIHLEWVQQNNNNKNVDCVLCPPGTTDPFPWQSWRACPHPLPTHRGPALCREPGRYRGTGGLGERSERSGSQPGWERGDGTWRLGGLICTYPQRETDH